MSQCLGVNVWMEHPKAKERNSVVILAEIHIGVQVVFIGNREKLFSGRRASHEKFLEVEQLLEELCQEAAKTEACREQLEQENLRLREQLSNWMLSLLSLNP